MPVCLGLGLGLVLAGVLLLLSPSRGPSREQVVSLAREYGMVFKDEIVPWAPLLAEDRARGSGNPSVAGSSSASIADKLPVSGSGAAGKPVGSGEVPPPGPESSSKLADAQPTVEVAASRPVVIPSGSTSEEVAGILLQAGIIEDKATFLNLVNQGNLSRRLRAGIYNLTPGTAMEALLFQITL